MISIIGLLKSFRQISLPFNLGKFINQGNQGQVFESINNPDKVIKLSILFDKFNLISMNEEFESIANTYKYIINNPNTSIASTYEFGELYRGHQDIFKGEQKYIIFYSIMEKLIPLNENEQKIFKTICSAYNKELKTYRPIEDIILELTEWIDFDKDKVIEFYSKLPSLNIEHKDFEPRNIMKDKVGNYKIIDFDLATLKEKIK